MKTQISNAIHLFPNLHRALEVAALAGLTVKPFCNPDDYPVDQALADIRYSGAMKYMSEDGQVFCEIVRPQFSAVLRQANAFSVSEFNNWLDTLEYVEKPTEFEKPSTAQLLLKTAWEKADLTIEDYNVIMKIAQSAAIIARSKKIKAEHVAEGIHYRIRFTDNLGNPIGKAIPLRINDQ